MDYSWVCNLLRGIKDTYGFRNTYYVYFFPSVFSFFVTFLKKRNVQRPSDKNSWNKAAITFVLYHTCNMMSAMCVGITWIILLSLTVRINSFNIWGHKFTTQWFFFQVISNDHVDSIHLYKKRYKLVNELGPHATQLK